MTFSSLCRFLFISNSPFQTGEFQFRPAESSGSRSEKVKTLFDEIVTAFFPHAVKVVESIVAHYIWEKGGKD
jgi:hypothetical protein